MALATATIFEVRTTGNMNNGGGFYDRDPGTSVDYSQQDAAQLSLTDLAATQANGWLIVTSATGGFTAAMVGNIIHITAGTNFIAGWYEITAYGDTNTISVDRACGQTGDASSGTGKVGGALALGSALDNEFFNALIIGNTVWIKAGEYTMVETVDSQGNDAFAVTPIYIKGYNATRGDNPTLASRPVIACGTYTFTWGDYWDFRNISWTGTAANLVGDSTTESNYSTMYNCYVLNSSATANRNAVRAGILKAIKCELISTNGNAFLVGSFGFVLSSYIHDSVNGVKADGSYAPNITNSIIDTCSTAGIYLGASRVAEISRNVIYGNGTGILATSAYSCTFVNNIIDSNTTGASWGTATPNNFWDFNAWGNNTTDTNNVTKGDNSITSATTYLPDAGNDFTLPVGSACLGAGMKIGEAEGVDDDDYKINIGVDQDDNAAGGGEQTHPSVA